MEGCISYAEKKQASGGAAPFASFRFSPLALCILCLALAVGLAVTPSLAETPAQQARMVSLPINEVLRIVSSSKGSADRPIVRVELRSGSRFDGVVTDYSPEKGVCTIIDRNDSPSILALPEVAAVTVLHAGSALIALQGGKIYRSESDAVPSKLELRRTAERLTQKFGTSVQCVPPDGTAEDADCRFSYGKVTTALDQALTEISKDAMGRQALTDKKGGIRCEETSGAPLALGAGRDGEILIKLDCGAPLDAGYETTIRDELNKLL